VGRLRKFCGRAALRITGRAGAPDPSGVAIGICDQTSELLERVALYLNQGYRRVKIKIQPRWDEEPVAAVRARFPDVSLMVDANGPTRFLTHRSFFGWTLTV